MVVIFNKNYTGWLDSYRILKEAYEPIFGAVLFTGFKSRPEEIPESEPWVECDEWEGTLQYACFANVIQVSLSRPPSEKCTPFSFISNRDHKQNLARAPRIGVHFDFMILAANRCVCLDSCVSSQYLCRVFVLDLAPGAILNLQSHCEERDSLLGHLWHSQCFS
jgi:hypothetical protein